MLCLGRIMARRVRKFLTVQQALEVMLEDDDLVVLPPESSGNVTDEEAIDENNIETDIQNDVPKDVCGTVELHNRDLSDSDEEFEEPPRKLKKKIKPEKWRKSEKLTNNVQPFQGVSTKDRLAEFNVVSMTPLQIFRKYFNEKMYAQIIEQTRMYAHQKNNINFSISAEDLDVFLAIILLSGYHQMPQQSMYWSQAQDCSIKIVSTNMSKNRFIEMKKFLHFKIGRAHV